MSYQIKEMMSFYFIILFHQLHHYFILIEGVYLIQKFLLANYFLNLFIIIIIIIFKYACHPNHLQLFISISRFSFLFIIDYFIIFSIRKVDFPLIKIINLLNKKFNLGKNNKL